VSTEPLQIFDPHRNFQLQGFTSRGATSTRHDATATGVSISGIIQAAEDFAVLSKMPRIEVHVFAPIVYAGAFPIKASDDPARVRP
jgi:hypothetical protein